jgi:hypothetical protein
MSSTSKTPAILGSVDHAVLGDTDGVTYSGKGQLNFEDIGTSTNGRKRAMHKTNSADAPAQSPAKKSKTQASEVVLEKGSPPEIGDDPVSPSPAGKKTKSKAIKVAPPKKKNKGAVDGESSDKEPSTSSPVPRKKMTAAARRKAEAEVAAALEKDRDYDNLESTTVNPRLDDQATGRAPLNQRALISGGEQTIGTDEQGSWRSRPLSEKFSMPGKYQQMITSELERSGVKRCRPAAQLVDDASECETEHDHSNYLEQWQRISRQHDQVEYGIQQGGYQDPEPPYYAPNPQAFVPPPVRPPPLYPFGPNYGVRGSSLHPYVRPATSRTSSRPASAALTTGISPATRLSMTPERTGPYTFRAVPPRPISAQFPSSAQAGDPLNNPRAECAERPQRPLGRIYIDGGSSIMVEECPGCRRGFQ